ncbi:hypothetical protein [Halalkalibacter akibai]|uniref:Group-specific protein n=1 Tax=Halalkalibacter akibai (strain ATCC 43226 / DSM 21942 / CIP 109018 / JCM 9157 / 1139) TaxID=1236973 RepID=W4QRY6_HALA3|nr:hypothetical protein [Halalkalibacter akibai]GAE34861.1 group-specific protein [Halalkalibacter akibai JCM 9157]
MNVFILVAIIFVPLGMWLLQVRWNQAGSLFTAFSILSLTIFGYITAEAIYTILKANEVFMTTIHGIFLKPLFLITGSYLGLYLLYRTWSLLWRDLRG